MTLTQFLTTTGAISDRDLRPALARALGEEIPRSRDSFDRFYGRVIVRLVESGALPHAA